MASKYSQGGKLQSLYAGSARAQSLSCSKCFLIFKEDPALFQFVSIAYHNATLLLLLAALFLMQPRTPQVISARCQLMFKLCPAGPPGLF